MVGDDVDMPVMSTRRAHRAPARIGAGRGSGAYRVATGAFWGCPGCVHRTIGRAAVTFPPLLQGKGTEQRPDRNQRRDPARASCHGRCDISAKWPETTLDDVLTERYKHSGAPVPPAPPPWARRDPGLRSDAAEAHPPLPTD